MDRSRPPHVAAEHIGAPDDTIAPTVPASDHDYTPTADEIGELLGAEQINYEAVFSTVPTQIDVNGFNVELDFHYLRFNANGEPKIRELIQILTNHLVLYAIEAQRTNRPLKSTQSSALLWEAIQHVRTYEESGEAGELLLYFLMETVLKAPQMVAKISLKTNRDVEIHGSDGIHARWDPDHNQAELFFGEAKIHDDIYSALDAAAASLRKFYAEELEHEIRLLTNHYQHAAGPLKDYILAYANGTDVPGSASLNHAILLGYDWDQYQRLERLPVDERDAALKQAYAADHGRLWELLRRRVAKLNIQHIHLHVFFLPFRTVQEFRKAFHDRIFGGTHS